MCWFFLLTVFVKSIEATVPVESLLLCSCRNLEGGCCSLQCASKQCATWQQDPMIDQVSRGISGFETFVKNCSEKQESHKMRSFVAAFELYCFAGWISVHFEHLQQWRQGSFQKCLFLACNVWGLWLLAFYIISCRLYKMFTSCANVCLPWRHEVIGERWVCDRCAMFANVWNIGCWLHRTWRV